MPPFDSKPPPPPVETNQDPPPASKPAQPQKPPQPQKSAQPQQPAQPQKPAQAGGVRVRVRELAPPLTPEPPAPERHTVVVPPNQSRKDLESYAKSLQKQWGPRIREKLLTRGGIDPRSVQELQQDVLVLMCIERTAGRTVEYEGAYIDKVIDNAFLNRSQRNKVPIVAGVDPDATHDSTPDPESLVQRARNLRKLERCRELLPPELKAVFQAREIDGLTLEETGAKLGLITTTVHKRQVRAREYLKDLVRASGRPPRQK
jgi:RNA polymerase sigma factor (sigma-70 family)